MLIPQAVFTDNKVCAGKFCVPAPAPVWFFPVFLIRKLFAEESVEFSLALFLHLL